MIKKLLLAGICYLLITSSNVFSQVNHNTVLDSTISRSISLGAFPAVDKYFYSYGIDEQFSQQYIPKFDLAYRWSKDQNTHLRAGVRFYYLKKYNNDFSDNANLPTYFSPGNETDLTTQFSFRLGGDEEFQLSKKWKAGLGFELFTGHYDQYYNMYVTDQDNYLYMYKEAYTSALFAGIEPLAFLTYTPVKNISIGFQTSLSLSLALGEAWSVGNYGHSGGLFLEPFMQLPNTTSVFFIQYNFKDSPNKKWHTYNEDKIYPTSERKKKLKSNKGGKNEISLSAFPTFFNQDYSRFKLAPKFDFRYARIIKKDIKLRAGARINWYASYKVLDEDYSVMIDSTLFQKLTSYEEYLNYSLYMGIEGLVFRKEKMAMSAGLDLTVGKADYYYSEGAWNLKVKYRTKGESSYSTYAGIEPFISLHYTLSKHFSLSLQTGIGLYAGLGSTSDFSHTLNTNDDHIFEDSVYRKLSLPTNTTALFINYHF